MMVGCIVCGKERWPTIDHTTGFRFCDEHLRAVKIHFTAKRSNKGSDWLRSIADVLESVGK